jgi:hypothetical protein
MNGGPRRPERAYLSGDGRAATVLRPGPRRSEESRATVRTLVRESRESYISGVLLQITARPDARLIGSAVRRGLRRPLLLARGAGWGLIAVALLFRLGPVLLAVGALLAAVVPMVLVNAVTRPAGGTTTYEISDRGLAMSGHTSRHAYAWTAFSYAEEMAGQLVFGLGRFRVVTVPTGSLTRSEIDQVLLAAAAGGVTVRGITLPAYV